MTPASKPRAPSVVWVLFARRRAPRIYLNAPTQALREGETLALYDFAASFVKAAADEFATPKPRRGRK